MQAMFKALSVLLVVLAACKAPVPAGSEVKTLVEVASGGEFGAAICKGDGKNAKAAREFLAQGGVEHATYAETETAASALAALPPALFSNLKNANAQIVLTNDPAAYCEQAMGSGNRGALGKIDACYVWVDRGGRDGLDIVLRGHWGKIGTTLIKEIGYVVAQNGSNLRGADADFSKDKDRIAQAFLRDMVASRVFAVKGLKPLLGDDGVDKLVSAAKSSDTTRDLLVGLSKDRRSQVTDFIFAEAFDSFYCRSADSVSQSDTSKLQALAKSGGSKATAKSVIEDVTNTRLAMKVLFPRAHAAFLKTHNERWPSARGGFSLDEAIGLDSPAPSTFPYADGGSPAAASAAMPSPQADMPVTVSPDMPPMDFTSTSVTPQTGMSYGAPSSADGDDFGVFDGGDSGGSGDVDDDAGIKIISGLPSKPAATPKTTETPAYPPTSAFPPNTPFGPNPDFRPAPLTGGAFTSLPELYDDKIDYGAQDNSREAIMERINARAKELEENPALAEERLMKRHDYRFTQEAIEAAGLKDKCGNLSPAECMGVYAYTQTDYAALNRQARENEPPIVRPMSSGTGFKRIRPVASDAQQRAENGYVDLLEQRVVLESALTKLEASDAGYNGTVNRWTNLPPEVAATYVPGAKVKFDGFTSTTTIADEANLPPSLKSIADGTNTRFIIEDARGANLERLSAFGATSNSNEREILLRPTEMEVLSSKMVTLPNGQQQRLVRLKQVHGGMARGTTVPKP